MRHVHRTFLIITGAAIAAALVLLYALVDPSSHLFPRCIVLTVTGYQCPGCGSQRAVHSLLSGNVTAAWHFNAMLVASIPLIILMLIAAWRKHHWPRLYNALNSLPAIVMWAMAVIAWTIFRNL
ncbi:MAG: DUF2752 domain-containing protein [Paramuribaculum sp.]|nr:DUF2752 domain-containing protein [Paramuribaculum sp.]